MRRVLVGLSCLLVVLSGCRAASDDPAIEPPGPDVSPTPGRGEPTPPPQEPSAPDEPPHELAEGTWTRLEDAPVALTEVAAAVLGGQLWVAGGLDSSGTAVSDVWTYDPTFGQWGRGPDLPAALHHTALVSTGTELLVLGGYEGSGFRDPSAAVWRLDLTEGVWVQAPPLPGRRAAGAAAWDGRRVVYGGGVGPTAVHGEVFAAAPGQGWEQIGEFGQPREHLAATGDGAGRVWFLGGRDGGLDATLADVDVVVDGTVHAGPELPTARGGVAAFWSITTGACLAGGEESAGTFAEVECVDGDGGVTSLPSLGVPRHGLGAGVIDGIAYVVLGGPAPGLTVSATVEALSLDP